MTTLRSMAFVLALALDAASAPAVVAKLFPSASGLSRRRRYEHQVDTYDKTKRLEPQN
jgi:hypothetical protein